MTTPTTGPYWLVFVNNTAVDPDHPLPVERAANAWQRIARHALETGGGARVELVQVTPEELDLAPAGGGGQ